MNQWRVAHVSYFPPQRSLASVRYVDSRLRVRCSQDFKGFWESRFGGKKEPEEQNGHANGSVPKRTSDLAVYEQFEQQVVWTAAPPPACDPLFRPDACSCMLCCQLGLVDCLIPVPSCFRPGRPRSEPPRFAMETLM